MACYSLLSESKIEYKDGVLNYMARIVQTLDSAIQRINIEETNCAIQWIEIYPMDSVIHLLKQLGPVM